MAEAWQILEFPPEWEGHYARRQSVEISRMASAITRNVDFYGAVGAKRAGQQFVTAIRQTSTADGTTGTIPLVDPTQFTVRSWVLVMDPRGLFGRRQVISNFGGVITLATDLPFAPAAGSQVIWVQPLHGCQLRTSNASNAQVVWLPTTVSDFQVFPPGTAVVIRDDSTGIDVSAVVASFTAPDILNWESPFGTPPLVASMVFCRIDGMFQAVYRDGSRKLLAAAGAGIFDVVPGSVTPVPLQYPTVTPQAVAAVGSTWTGTLSSYQGLMVSQRVALKFAQGVFSGTITAINLGTPAVTILLDRAPGAGNPSLLYLMPTRPGGDTVFVQYANVTHITAENAPPAKLMAGSLYRHGIRPPTTAMTAAAGAAGVLNGTYRYRCKFRCLTSGQESEPGFVVGNDGAIDIPVVQLQATVTGLVNKKVDLTNIPVSTDPQVTMKDIYRSTQDSDGVWYFLTELSNATTTYTDNTSDTGLGRPMREFVDDPLPDDATVVSLWPQANRLVALRPDVDAVVFSDQFDLETGYLKGESWPPDNMIFVNYDDGDRLTGIAALHDALLIFKQRSVWRIDGIPPDLTISPVSFRADLTGIGAIGPKAIAIDQNEAMFMSQDGLYSIDRRENTDAFQSKRLSAAIDEEWGRMSVPQRGRSHLTYYRRFRQLRSWLPVDGFTEPTLGLVYQLEGQPGGHAMGWSVWDIARDGENLRVSASCVAQTDTADVVYIGSDRGEVLQMDVGTADLEIYPFQFEWATMPFAPGGMGRPCRTRACDPIILALSNCSLGMKIVYEFGDRSTEKVIPLTAASGFILDTGRLDVDTLGGNRARFYGRLMLGRGEYHQIVFSEFSNLAAFRILAWNYWVQVLSVPALRRSGA